jgi:hypothetical protein
MILMIMEVVMKKGFFQEEKDRKLRGEEVRK